MFLSGGGPLLQPLSERCGCTLRLLEAECVHDALQSTGTIPCPGERLCCKKPLKVEQPHQKS